MIVLYNSIEKDFSHNGIGILKDCIKAEVREELNGNFTLDLEYPLQNELSSFFVRGNIVKCPVGDSRQDQLFRIRRCLKNTRTVNIYAEHIAIADLGTNFIVDTNIVGKTRLEALQQILDKALEKHSFKASGSTGGKQDILRIVRYSPLRAIMGTEENTLINRYNGEIEFDNFNIRVVETRGEDNDVLIAYGKNIEGIEETMDDNELATCIIPEGTNGLLLPEYKIDSPYINSYEKVYFKHVKLDNIGVIEKSGDNPGVTKEEALQKIRDTVSYMFNVQKVDMINANYRVNFISLSKTEEYKNYAVLETVAMGDTVTIKHTKLNLELRARVFKTTYNALKDKLEEIELGFSKKTLSNIIKDTIKKIEFTKEKVEIEVSNLDKTMSAKIEITENGINENIKNVKEGLENNISKTAEGLKIDLKDTKEKLESKVDFTAKQIKIEFEEGDKNLNSYISETAKNIQMQVNNAEERASSKFEMLDREITLKVDKDGVISAINLNPGRAKISADKVDITGFVTISDLSGGSTTINGYCIKTGQIEGIHVHAENFSAKGSVYFYQGVNIGGDVYSKGTIGAKRDLQCEGNLNVTGTKNCIQTTKNFGKLLINAYETAEVYYGDLQFGVIKDGVCVVKIDPKMLECFNTEIPYHVFTQTYNGTNLKMNKYPSYVVFKGEEGTEFSYEIKAKRRGYENTRLAELIKKDGDN